MHEEVIKILQEYVTETKKNIEFYDSMIKSAKERVKENKETKEDAINKIKEYERAIELLQNDHNTNSF